jgi:N-acetylglucosaminyl-diphospho-decaprenol L-rhamnosyltransferase
VPAKATVAIVDVVNPIVAATLTADGPTVSSTCPKNRSANLWPENPWSRRYHNDSENPPRERDAGWLSGSCVLVRRAAFDAVGGFDDEYFMYFEDVDLGYRLSRSGWRNRYAPSALVRHSGAHSTDGDSRRMVLVHHQSAYRFMSSKYSGWYLAPVRLAVKIGLSARAYLVTRVFHRG